MRKSKTKTFIISFLALLFALCLGIALAACGKDEETKKDVYGVGEEGVYYYDADSGAEYTLTLQSGVYMITRGNLESYTGSYSYDEEERTITFKANTGDTFTAAFADDAMSVAIGTSATFLKSIDYTVTFVDGGVAVGEQSVRYGRAAEYVAGDDADRVFLGWYTDAALTTEYKFDAAVTGDMTLYAWYIDIDRSALNYEVTFVAADGTVLGTAETVNGRVYEFPEISGILGWWVSDTNEQSGLTYRYDAESNPENYPVLTESTKLFAVMNASGVLGASVYGDKVTWTANASSVTVTVDGDTKTTNAAGGSFSYDFASLSTGAHEIEVSATGYGTETLVYVANRLDRVSTFGVYGNFLVYNKVENAQYYYISVECANESHTAEAIYNGSTLYYDFSNCEMGPEGIKFTVYAYATGYETSVSETFVYRLVLDTPEVQIDAGTDTAVWADVAGATGYEVYVDGAYVGTILDNSYSLKYYDQDATISVAVKPVAPGYYSEISAAETYVKATLRAPEITSVSEYTISWGVVDGAVGYELNINGYLVTITAQDGESVAPTSYTLSDTDMEHISDESVNVLSITALAGTPSANSQQSDLLYVTDKTMDAALSYSNGTIYWQYALSASEYYVEYSGTTTRVGRGNSYDITFNHSGDNTVRVYFEDDAGERHYAEMVIYTYAVIFDVREKADTVDTIYVAKGDSITLREPENAEQYYSFGGWYTLPDNDTLADSYTAGGVLYVDEQLFSGSNTLILYAFWTREKAEVNLSIGNGTLTDYNGEAVDTAKIPIGTSEYTLDVPVSNDAQYVFYGWYAADNRDSLRYTDENGNGLAVVSTDANITLYAVYINAMKFSSTTYGGRTVYEVKKGDDISLLTEITVPATYNGRDVAVVNAGAFSSCSTLVTINLPDTLEYVACVNNGNSAGTSAFSSCTALTAVNVYATGDPDTSREITYYSEDGVLFWKNSIYGYVELLFYPKGKTQTTYKVPETVSNENEYEFDSSMHEIHVEREVRSIAVQAFYSFTTLETLILPGTLTNIGDKAFYGNSSLKTVTYSVELENADAAAATGLTIGTYAFQSCTLLDSVTLPAFMSDFNVNIFTSCSSLESIHIAGTGGNYGEVDGMLTNASGNQIVYCPKGRSGEVIISGSVTSIGDSAFESCTKITAVVIPSSVTYIGESAFSSCTALTTLTFQGDANSNRLEIATKAFYGCSVLEGSAGKNGVLYLPANLETLGSYAFGNCKALLSVYYDAWQGATSDDLAFDDGVFTTTSGTSYITTLTFGQYVPLLDINTFVGGTSLATVNIEDGNTAYKAIDGVVFSYDEKTLLYYPVAKAGSYNVPETVEVIGDSVFWKRTGLTSITIPVTVETIGDAAFKGDTALTTVTFLDSSSTEGVTAAESLKLGAEAFSGCTALTTVTLPERLVSIGDSAFYNCKVLTSITIPANVTQIGEYDKNGNLVSMAVFDTCSTLETITVATGNTTYSVIDGVLYMKEKGVETTLLYAPIKSSGDENNTVTIPGTVTTIWAKAFYNNSGVKHIKYDDEDVDDMDREIEIQTSAFQNCKLLEDIELPYGLTEIGESAFSGCVLLSGVSIPNTVTLISVGAFSGCTTLEKITFYGDGDEPLKLGDGTASTTGAGAFAGLTRLKEVELPERTSYIGTAAFRGCANLATINIPANVTTIGAYAFYGCSALVNFEMAHEVTEVTYADGTTETKDAGIGKLESIGDYAFSKSSVKELLYLPEGLVEIGGNAFGYSQIEAIAIPSTVTTFGSSTFSYAKSLSSITFAPGCLLTSFPGNCFTGVGLIEICVPSMVESIGDSCFYYCHTLQKIYFEPNSHCTTFGTNCFYYCSSLKEFYFPDLADEIMNDPSFSGITLGATMFNSCDAFEYMYISAGVFSIITSANATSSLFSGVSSTSKTTADFVFEISEDNEYLWQDAENKIIYSVTTDAYGNRTQGTILYLVYGEVTGEFTVPYGVTEISRRAFNYQTSITKLNFPSTLEKIGYYTFAHCTSLKEITFANDSAFSEVEDYAFAYCYSLETVEVPGSLKTLGSYMFRDCSSLKNVTLNEGLTSTGTYAFYGCTSLESITLPTTCTTVGAQSFRGAGLTSIDLTYVTSISGTYAFAECENLTTVTIPATIKTFSNYAFQSCTNLTTAVLSEGLTTCSSYMFDACSSLVNVTLPSTFTSIPTYCFRNCTALTSISIPAGVTSIGNYAFSGSGLTSVIIPGAVTSIGTASFSSCASLASVVFESGTAALTITSGTSTSTGAFCNSTAITTITLPARTSTFGNYTFYGCTGLMSVNFESGWTLTSIPTYVFYGCTELTSVSLPDCVTTVGTYAFYGCEKLVAVGTTENVYDLSNVTSIGAYAFSGSGVKELIFGEVTDDNTDIFYQCLSLESIAFTGPAKIGKASFAGCTSLKSLSLTTDISITAGSGSGATTYGAFANCTALEAVELGDLTTIPAYTFYGCSSLSKVASSSKDFVDGTADLTGITSFGVSSATTASYNFYGCASLVNVILDEAITYVSNYTFSNCTSLETINLDNVTALGNYVFDACSALDDVNLLNVTSIGTYAFRNCTSLTEADISSCTSVGNYDFYGCTSLETVVLSDALTSTGTYVFYNCTSLTKIDLPYALTTIGTYAFYGCESLEEITITGNVSSIGNYAFAASGLKDITVDLGNSGYKDVDGVLYTRDDVLVYYPSGRTEEEAAVIPEGHTVGAYSFAFNSTTKTVILPDDTTEIADYAFQYATGLTSIEIPSGVVSIGAQAFRSAENLASVTLPYGLEIIDQYAFYLTALESVEIPATVTTIGNYAFAGTFSATNTVAAGAYATTTVLVPLETVTFGATGEVDVNNEPIYEEPVLTSLGTQAFAGTALKEIEIPASVTTINANAFQACLSLEKVVINSAPASLGTYTFADCSALESVTLPDGMASLSNYMFVGCTALKTIDLPDSLTYLGIYTFMYSGLEKIEIPERVLHISATEGVESTSNGEATYTFYGCESLETLILSNNIQSIGAYVFSHCTGLKYITYEDSPYGAIGSEGYMNAFPESLDLLARNSFEYCAFETIVIPASLTTLYQYVFSYNTALKKVVLEDGLIAMGTNLSNYGFLGCTSLESINFPDSLGYVGDYLFQDCTSLSQVLLDANACVGSNVFSGWTEAQNIYLPFTQFRVEGAWSSNWKNNCNANIYFYMEKPDYNTDIVDIGLNYWYYDEANGTVEIDGHKLSTWRYEDIASDATDYVIDSSVGTYVRYLGSEQRISGMGLYNEKTGEVEFVKAINVVESSGSYYVKLSGGSVYLVTLTTEGDAYTATATEYIRAYAIAGDSGSYVSIYVPHEGDAAIKFYELYLYAGAPGQYATYIIDEAIIYAPEAETEDEEPDEENEEPADDPLDGEQTPSEDTDEDEDEANEITYIVTTEDGRAFLVTVCKDGTAYYVDVTVELSVAIDSSLNSVLGSWASLLDGLYIVFDYSDDAVVTVGYKLAYGGYVIYNLTMDIISQTKAEYNGTYYYVITVEDGYTFVGTIPGYGEETSQATIYGIIKQYYIGSDDYVSVLLGTEPRLLTLCVFDARGKAKVYEIESYNKVEVTDEDGEVVSEYYDVTIDGLPYVITLNDDKGTATWEHKFVEIAIEFDETYTVTIVMDLTDDAVTEIVFTYTGGDGKEVSVKYTTASEKVEDADGDYYLVSFGAGYTFKIAFDETEGAEVSEIYRTFTTADGYITVSLGETDSFLSMYVYDSVKGVYVECEIIYVKTTTVTKTTGEGDEAVTVTTTYYEITVNGVPYMITLDTAKATATVENKVEDVTVTIDETSESFTIVMDYTADEVLAVKYETVDDDGETVTVEMAVDCEKVYVLDEDKETVKETYYLVTITKDYVYKITFAEDGTASARQVVDEKLDDSAEGVNP